MIPKIWVVVYRHEIPAEKKLAGEGWIQCLVIYGTEEMSTWQRFGLN
jgi:hypothetical protein